MLSRAVLVTLLASTCLLACGSDDGGGPGGSGTTTSSGSGGSGGDTTSTGTGGSTSTGGATSLGGGGSGGALACDNDGFVVAQERVLGGGLTVATLYRARTAESPPYDSLSIQLWHDQGAPTGAFVFDFAGENYTNCNTCGLIATDCADDGFETCGQLFLIVEGQLDITSNAAKLTGSLTNARAVEVTIDWDSFVSTEVPNGEDWCIASHTFDTTVTPN